MEKSKKSGKERVHATISDESDSIIKKYVEEYGSKSAVVDAAIKVFKRYKEPYLGDTEEIWSRARAELNMVLVGKTTFLSYIKGNAKDAYTENIALEAIEWYLGKHKEEMKLEDFLNGLKGMWKVANYFRTIELEKNEKGAFKISFNHDMTKNYSVYWAGYFETLLKEHWNCSIDSFVGKRNESFHLIIKE